MSPRGTEGALSADRGRTSYCVTPPCLGSRRSRSTGTEDSECRLSGSEMGLVDFGYCLCCYKILELHSVGSGASGDFGREKGRWRTEDRQAAKHKCLISGRFPSLTRVIGHVSAPDEGLLSADAPEPNPSCLH